MWYYLDTVVAIYHGPTMRTSETAKEMVVNEKVIRFSPSFIHLILSLARSLDFFNVCISLTLLLLVQHYYDRMINVLYILCVRTASQHVYVDIYIYIDIDRYRHPMRGWLIMWVLPS